MGKINRGILGGIQGKVGPVVGGSWKGIDYLRSLPASVANPKTAGQTLQRGKFRGVQVVISALLVAIVKPLWDRFAQRQSGANVFMSQNVGIFNEDGTFSTTELKTSRGSLLPIEGVTAVAPIGGTDITVSWDDNSGTGSALSSDELYVAYYNQTDNEWETFQTGTREDETVVLTLASNIAPDTIQNLYFSFRRVDGSLVSNSVHVVATT